MAASPPKAVNLGGSLWQPYKDIANIVNLAVFKKDIDIVPDLEAVLRKHKPDFIALLKNPPKNAESREIIQKGPTVGIPVQGQSSPQILPQQLLDEALIISDMFELNEVAAVELLLAGESQLAQYPGLNRGLVAVLLYYDARRSLVTSLRALIQARGGHTWTLGLCEELVTLATKYTDQLMEEGLVTKILDLIKSIDFVKEIDKLQMNRAIGNPKHRKQVVDFIIEIKEILAECLYCWACQSGLSRDHTMQLITYLSHCSPTEADGSLDNVHLTLVMALLYAVDVSVLEQIDDSEEFAQQLPIIRDAEFLPAVHRTLTGQQAWDCQPLKAVFQFAWAISLRILSQYSHMQDFGQYFEEDETIVDQALEKNIFFFLRNCIVNNPFFHQEEFYVKRIHNLITDFIIQMPLKVKELRNRGDETARIILAHQQEGLEPPTNLPRHFEHLLQLIASLYDKDPLKLELIQEYWCSTDSSPGLSTMFPHRSPQRQVTLHKFIRSAGDLLPPSLYVPYVSMLTSLSRSAACAHHCYNLLKTNGTSAGGHCSTVSWDHFFLSLNRYYTNLRQEIPLGSDTQHIYRHRPVTKGITPAELEGLTVVLQLMRTIAEQHELSRLALCENQQWLPLVVLLGLIGCSVPAFLKAELLLTLAAFAHTPSIASNLWQSLEISQVLQTVKTTSAYQLGGIQVELDEIEARNEEFPMTRAFLHLLSVLIDANVPPNLGVGNRSPGFDPYLEFVRDSVFLKFNTRAYKNLGEKWEVAAGCLLIFYKLLKNHSVLLEDFYNQTVELQGGGSTIANKRPGHNVLIHMLHDGGMLKMILYIIDEGTRQFDQYTNFVGKTSLEQCSLLCLKLLDETLAKQSSFLDALRESGSALLVSSLDKLLLGINPRSGRPDHLIRISKYITYCISLPEHALYSVKILTSICQSLIAQPQLVTLFTADQAEANVLRNGFVECLETEDNEDNDQIISESIDGLQTQGEVRNATRHGIVTLLLVCLPQPSPNLAHFLLGFEIRKPVSKTILQDPGILGLPRTCLHIIIQILSEGLNSRFGPTCVHQTPALAEVCYHLIYSLCANKDTSGPTLRYLRTTHDFLFRQLQHLPFKIRDSGDKEVPPVVLVQQSWLLKACAIELRITSLNRQRSHVQRLVGLLLDNVPENFMQSLPPKPAFEESSSVLDINTFSASQHQPLQVTGNPSHRKLLKLLDHLDLAQEQPPTPCWEYFDNNLLENAISNCEVRHSSGLVSVNIDQLHHILNNELNESQGVTVLGQRPRISQEIQNILAYVIKRNKIRENIHAKRQLLESWRQATEILLTVCSQDFIEKEKRQAILFEIIQELLRKVLDPLALPELTNPVSGVILTLLANLRQCFLASQMPSSIPVKSNLSLDSTLMKESSVQLVSSRTVHSASLQVVLRRLIECITKSGLGPQRVRANYYAALLNFLRIAQKDRELSLLEFDNDPKLHMEARILDAEPEHEKLMRENIEVILSYGEHLMEVICRDCCSGHDIGRMLALACLDTIVSIDKHQHWLMFMASKGYLHHLIDSILNDDAELQGLINNKAFPLRALYVYESKMALLVRLASTVRGANTLLENNIMKVLSECRVFDMRPEQDPSQVTGSGPLGIMDLANIGEEVGFMSTAMGCYRQALFPALRLCLAITTSLGIENRDASAKVLSFIISHGDIFSSILREHHIILTLPVLQELSLVTRVIARTAIDDASKLSSSDPTTLVEIKGQMNRLQQLMLALLQRYAFLDTLHNYLESIPEGSARNAARIALLEILANVLAYCRSLVASSGSNLHFYRTLFAPNLVEAVTRDSYNIKDLQTVTMNLRPPNIGIIAYHLRQCTTQFMNAYESYKTYLRKLQSLPELGLDEMKEFLPDVTSLEKLSGKVRKQTVHQRLVSLVEYKMREFKLYSYMLENTLFLLWHHLHCFFLYSSPLDDNRLSLSRSTPAIRKIQDSSFNNLYPVLHSPRSAVTGSIGLNSETLKQLKIDATACINETLFKKLQEIAQTFSCHNNHYSFVEALVRRLRRLINIHAK